MRHTRALGEPLLHGLHRTLAAALLAGTTCIAASANAVPSPSETAPLARVIVKFKSASPLAKSGAGAPDRATVVAKRLGVALASGPALSAEAQVLTARGITSRALAQRLAADTDVEYAVEDQRRRRHVA